MSTTKLKAANRSTLSRSWKKLWADLQQCKSDIRTNAHKIATILTALFNDREFRDEKRLFDDAQTLDELDKHCADLCIKFKQLEMILKYYPDEATWTEHSLLTLYGMAREQDETSRRRGREQAGLAKKSRERPTTAEHQKLQQQLEQSQTRLSSVEQDAKTWREQIAEKDRLILELREKLAKAEGTIETLRAENQRLLRIRDVA